jgi:hypothetical protein
MPEKNRIILFKKSAEVKKYQLKQKRFENLVPIIIRIL